MNEETYLIYSKAMELFKGLYSQLEGKREEIDNIVSQIDNDENFQLKFLILCHKLTIKKGINTKISNRYIDSIQHLDMKEGLLSLFNEDNHWTIYGSSLPNTLDIETRIGFLGNYNSGKTFLINSLFTIDIPLAHTKHISQISIKNLNSLRILDTPGLRNPMIKDKNESKNRDFFIKNFILNSCNLVFYIVSSYDLKSQKELEEIKNDAVNAKTTLIVVHNLFNIQSKEDYDKYIEKYILIRDGITKYANTVSEIKGNREILHFVLGHSSTYLNYIEIIEKMKQHIQVTQGSAKKSFEDLIIRNIEKTYKVMCKDFENQELEVKDSNGKGDMKVIDLKKPISNTNPKLNEYNKVLYESLLTGNNCNYAYYIKNQDTLVIEIEMVQFTNFKIKVNVVGPNTIFLITADKEIPKPPNSISSSMNSMYQEGYDIKISIPLVEAVLSSKMLKNKTNENGLIILEYSLLINSIENEVFN